jgi:hypothetical protein
MRRCGEKPAIDEHVAGAIDEPADAKTLLRFASARRLRNQLASDRADAEEDDVGRFGVARHGHRHIRFRARYARRRNNGVERGGQVANQILRRLDTDRQPNERIGNAGGCASFGIHRRVRHRRRMRNQTLYTTERLGECEAL